MSQILHTNRATFSCTGEDATHFLENLVTCLISGKPAFGALLTPQGKILFDFFITPIDGGYRFDCAAEQRDELIKRLGFYKLRAKVDLAPLEEAVVTSWGDATRPDDAFDDPRLSALGWRAYRMQAEAKADDDAWLAHRIALGVPELGVDAEPGSVFPHDMSMDQFSKGSGVAFDKGCYVGQEVVSRMQHRGTARSRFVNVAAVNDLPESGAELMVGDRTIGTLGSVSGQHGLALVRLDRAAKAITEGAPITADGTEVMLTLPDWVNYAWPQ
ncbi:folate-binding protein YgfZ [Ahrensia sp. R2A130]|uniref:CAF17-like 4Fe-4S cluster assembly/insertion protein YgfZ n=1 Tax=Ahrensia sp. R2A130 TaxID=744979 RepID=UPI00068350F1|nr:folate-binding protein YgfZ [Ahrensia sp. R2A130]